MPFHTATQDFDRLRYQARTERDFTELSERCAARARSYEVKCTETRSAAGSAAPQAAEIVEHYAKLALHWKELAELYAGKASGLRPGP